MKNYMTREQLIEAYTRRCERDTANGLKPEMELAEFIEAWEREPLKLAKRHKGADGFVMLRPNQTEALSVQNYKIVRRMDYYKHITVRPTELSQRHRDNISRAMRGKNTQPKSEDHKKAISQSLRGRTVSPETRRRMSKAKTGKKRGPYKKKRPERQAA